MTHPILKYTCKLIASIVGVLVISGLVHSAEYIIDSAVMDTNGGNTLDGNDTLTITESGSISPPTDTNGVMTTGTFNTVSNFGSINTIGTNAEGIFSTGNNDTVTNSGDIITMDDESEGILSEGNDTTIINNGSISTMGFESYGIRANSAGPSVTNNGSITTAGVDAEGIYSDEENTIITNNGTISTSGNNSDAILMTSGDNSIINNNGLIYSAQDDGITLDDGGDDIIINNRGRIISTHEEGIQINTGVNNSVINNSGSISGGQYAIFGGTGNTTLNLLPHSQLLGAIDMGDDGGDIDTVNIYGGSVSANLTIDNAEAINLIDAAGVVNGNNVITVDPTFVSTYGAALRDLTSSVHHTISQRMTRPQPIKPVKVATTMLSPGILYREQEPLAWGQVFGGKRERNANETALAYDHDLVGIVFGYENNWRTRRAGVIGGIAQSDTESKIDAFNIDTKSYFLGGYGYFHAGKLDITASLLGGYNNYDNDRIVIDNLNGIEIANSDFSGYFLSPSLNMGSAIPVKEHIEFRPSARVTYSKGWLDDYSESGSTASNLSIDKHTVSTWLGRLQLAAAYALNSNREIELRVGAASHNTDNESIDASLSGNGFRFLTVGNESMSGGFAGASFRMATRENINLLADLEYGDFGGDEDYLFGRINLVYHF